MVRITIKLRNLTYINKKLLEDYIATIEDYIYEEETQKVSETIPKAAGAKSVLLLLTHATEKNISQDK